jgi:para-nitrobenzyl esterase
MTSPTEPGGTATSSWSLSTGAIVSATIGAVICLIAGCATTSEPHPSPDIATSLDIPTTSGHLHGVRTDSGREFRGVPYAEPPIGAQRWELPRPVRSPDADVDATHPGSPCPQSAPVPGDHPPPSEDCLTLSVTTPGQQDPAAPLPVMVWWHGGGYTSGAGSAYDAQRLADRGDVIVVSVNYRLGVFGYLGMPGMAHGGDFGFADQLESLRWVQANAAAFGGDPDNVTVFGESAGAMSACAALTSPASEGLLDKALLSSGSCMLQWPDGTLYPGVPAHTPYASRTENEATSIAAGRRLGCAGVDAVDCLRSLPVERLLTVTTDFSDNLTYGTELLPENPADVLRDHTRRPIPVVTGGNHDEQRSFVGGLLAASPDAVTSDTYPDLVATAFGQRADDIMAQYPLDAFPSAGLAWATLTTDAVWSCPTLTGARLMAHEADTYIYEFADQTAPNVNQITTIPQGAAHATDTPYYFDLGGADLLRTPRQKEIAGQMIDFWTSFAHDGVPRTDTRADVDEVTDDTTRAWQFATAETGYVDYANDHHCGFWAGN